MEKKKTGNIKRKIAIENTNFMDSLRKTVFLAFESKKTNLNKLSEESGIPYSTLKTFLYGNAHDINLSNAIKISRALGIGIDELTNAGTIGDEVLESIRMCRNLPERDIYLVRWFIRYLHSENSKICPGKQVVSVMVPELDNNGNLRLTSNYIKEEISIGTNPAYEKIFFGLLLNCDNYMPHFSPDDVLFIANDRSPKPSETVVLRCGKYIFLARQKIEGGIVKFYSIRDGKFRKTIDEIDELVGYVVCSEALNKRI